MSLWLNILLILVFMLIGSVFAMTELALVSLRGSQIDQMEQEDVRGARVAKVAHDPNRFLSAVQIGQTLMNFLSASFGAASIAPYIIPVLRGWGLPEGAASAVTTVVLVIVLSYFSIVISELVPKRIALQQTEKIARAVVPVVDTFATICSPFIWLLGKTTNGLVRLLGFDPLAGHSEVSDDELRVLVSNNTRIDKEERVILDDVFDAAETTVAEVMRPRADVSFLEAAQPIAEAAAEVRDKPYSRYPVIGDDFDDIRGFVHVRDLLDVRNPTAQTVADVTREGISLPGTSHLLPSLSLLRRKGIHLAVVIDEYGGTDGIVTLEDMMEELIGDIHDEYDLPEKSAGRGPGARGQSVFVDGVATVDAGITIEDFADLTGLELEDGPYETVAGYFLAHTGQLAAVGDSLHQDAGYDMVVSEVEGRRIVSIEIRKQAELGTAGKPGMAGKTSKTNKTNKTMGEVIRKGKADRRADAAGDHGDGTVAGSTGENPQKR